MSKHLLRIAILFGISCQLFSSCQKKEEIEPAKEETPPVVIAPPVVETPGFFVVSSIAYSSSANARMSSEGVPASFDLGELRASDKYSFIIANGGSKPIFDVTLTSNNSPFEVSPKTIGNIPGKNTSGIVPILTIRITHGRSVAGGPAPFLPLGENKALISMAGKTISDNDTVEVKAEFLVVIEAKAVGVKIYNGDEQVFNPNSNVWYVDPTKPVKMVNTGNITIKAVLYHFQLDASGYNYVRVDDGTFDFAANGFKDITHILAANRDMYIEFSDNGTVVSTPYTFRIPETDIVRIHLSKPVSGAPSL